MLKITITKNLLMPIDLAENQNFIANEVKQSQNKCHSEFVSTTDRDNFNKNKSITSINNTFTLK